MLRFILGGAGAGKTALARKKISELPLDSPVLLIVPEQMSFDTERDFLEDMGTLRLKNTSVLSFSTLARRIFETYGGAAGNYADETAKLILINRAVSEVSDALTVYSGVCGRPDFGGLILREINKLKLSGVTPSDIEAGLKDIESDSLRHKIKDVSLIYSVYDALLYKNHRDSFDDLSAALGRIEGTDCFAGTYVFIDGFISFTAVQKRMIDRITMAAQDCYISLCLEREGDEFLFNETRRTYDELIRAANLSSVQIAAPIDLSPSRHDMPPCLLHLERNIFRTHSQRYDGSADQIILTSCGNEYDETDFVFEEIRRLVSREGFRYRDIAVMVTSGVYLPVMENAAAKYNIPCFFGEPESIIMDPLIRFTVRLLRSCITTDSENVVCILKYGLCDFTTEEISAFEDYLFVWDVKGSELSSEFYANPAGFDGSGDYTERLEMINKVRSRLMEMINSVKTAGKSGNAEQISAAIYHTLVSCGAKQSLEQKLSQLAESGDDNAAGRVIRLWDILMEILSLIPANCGDMNLSLEKYTEIFEASALNCKLAEIPQTLDSVSVGVMQNFRTAGHRAIFVMGANDNEFPKNPVNSGVFTDSEHRVLENIGLSADPEPRDRILIEQLGAYLRLSAARERLYLSYRLADVSGSPLLPSPLIKWMTDTFDIAVRSFERTVPQPSGDLYKPEYILQNPRLLYGDRIKLSPSAIESYYKCPFSYFCSGGLGIKPRKKAVIDPLQSGSIIHDVLHRLLSEEDIAQLGKDELEERINRLLEMFLKTKLGGDLHKSERFIHLYNRIRIPLVTVAQKLIEDINQSDFKPSDFEKPLDGNRPFCHMQDGESVYISGRIDRVDTLRSDQATYLRVIDYKSGRRRFNLRDVYHGIGMQMFIYLFALCGDDYKGAVPAGVGYITVKKPPLIESRNADSEKIKAALDSHYRMEGYSAGPNSGIDIIESFVRNKAAEMTRELLDGNLTASPISGTDYDICGYCDYDTVCGRKNPRTALNESREITKDNDEQTLERMREYEKRGELR
ncbi:MAG: PD-(D/E)XK nuclease family protein [Oscillospiraceae bacterium]|nr:PD-(D/E)XK nuclease family protein [Oscillospiraceae bacterium]